jgi:hypothetical protein
VVVAYPAAVALVAPGGATGATPGGAGLTGSLDDDPQPIIMIASPANPAAHPALVIAGEDVLPDMKPG